MGGEAPEECTPDICKMIILSHLESPSILSILPLHDWLSINEELRRNDYSKERINIPSNPRHYWRYRMHITLEELIIADSFNSEIKEMNINNNRA